MGGELDLSRLEGLVAAYEVGEHCVVVETEEGREIRITARRDVSTGKYVSEYERRTSLASGEHNYLVWAHTPAYQPCTDADEQACLEAAVAEVNRVHVY